jgi:hypothetical protein
MAAVRQVRTLMVEISKLLAAADSLMGTAGWEPRFGSTSLSGGATSILSPRNWIPYRAFRFYRHEERPTVAPCISVILDQQWPKQNVTEPLVCGLVLEYDSSGDVPEGGRLYDAAVWHLYAPGRKDDGSIVRIVPRDLLTFDSTAREMRSFAIPLAAVGTREYLEREIITRLQKEIATGDPSK